MYNWTDKDLKLLSDPSWRLDNLYYITNKAKQKVKLKKNYIQQYIHDHATQFNITLKPRQVGISTYWLIKYLDQACFNENCTVAILSHDRESLRKLFKIIRFAHKNMHPEVRPVVDKGGGSQYRLYFPEINSEIYCTLEAVSDAVSHLHISEMALNDDPDKIRTSMDAVPVKTGFISIETTARGYNHFYDFWMGADEYSKFFFPWYFHDEYKIVNHEVDTNTYSQDELKLINYAKNKYKINLGPEHIAFRRFKINQKKSRDNFLQEYPEDDASCFLTSGNAVFDLTKLKPMYDNCRPPIKEIDGLRIYEEPKKNEIYVLGADTAEGFGGDKSCVQVFKVRGKEQVACYTGDIKPSELAEVLVKVADYYKIRFDKRSDQKPLIGVERNNHGHAVILKLDEVLRYPRLFKQNDKLGWKTDSVTRPVMLNAFIEGVENGTIKLNDKETIGECLTLVNKNGKQQAEDGKHDDTVMAASISIQLCIDQDRLNIYSDIAKRIKI